MWSFKVGIDCPLNPEFGAIIVVFDVRRGDIVFEGGGKVKCTLVQALRLCTGRTAHRGSRGIALLFS